MLEVRFWFGGQTLLRLIFGPRVGRVIGVMEFVMYWIRGLWILNGSGVERWLSPILMNMGEAT